MFPRSWAISSHGATFPTTRAVCSYLVIVSKRSYVVPGLIRGFQVAHRGSLNIGCWMWHGAIAVTYQRDFLFPVNAKWLLTLYLTGLVVIGLVESWTEEHMSPQRRGASDRQTRCGNHLLCRHNWFLFHRHGFVCPDTLGLIRIRRTML